MALLLSSASTGIPVKGQVPEGQLEDSDYNRKRSQHRKPFNKQPRTSQHGFF